MKTIVIWLIVFGLFVTILGAYMTSFPGVNKGRAVGAVTADEQDVADRLHGIVDTLTQDFGCRDNAAALDGAATYLANLLRRAGYDVHEESGGAPGVNNIVADLPGIKAPSEVIVVAAHYDAEQRSPGADGNASGCAVLVEIARRLSGTGNARTLRFALLANGAGRHTGEPTSGAHAFVENAVKAKTQIVAALVLDSVGRFDSTPTQTYPFPLMLAYDDQATYLACVGDFASRDLVSKTVELMRVHAVVPAEGLVLPSFLPGVGFSDHSAFWAAGIHAATITDTGSYRSKYWGNAFDTADRLDYVTMARVATSLSTVIGGLAKKSTLE